MYKNTLMNTHIKYKQYVISDINNNVHGGRSKRIDFLYAINVS